MLAEMRAADPPVSYLVGTPKGRLSKLEKHLVTLPWQAVREGVDVKLLPQEQELYVLAQMAMGAPQADRRHGYRSRGTAHEARRRARQGTGVLAPRRCRGGARRRHLPLP